MTTMTGGGLVSRTGLLAASSLVLVAFALTAASRMSQIMKPQAPFATAAAAPRESIDLVFLDEPDGSIQVRRSDDRRLVQLIKPTTGGFVRGVMRGFARDRMERGVGSSPPFELAVSQAGLLTLTDMATGRATVLEAFGSTNRAAFASMLLPSQPDANAAPGTPAERTGQS